MDRGNEDFRTPDVNPPDLQEQRRTILQMWEYLDRSGTYEAFDTLQKRIGKTPSLIQIAVPNPEKLATMFPGNEHIEGSDFFTADTDYIAPEEYATNDMFMRFTIPYDMDEAMFTGPNNTMNYKAFCAETDPWGDIKLYRYINFGRHTEKSPVIRIAKDQWQREQYVGTIGFDKKSEPQPVSVTVVPRNVEVLYMRYKPQQERQS